MLSASVLPRRYVLRGGAEVEVPPPAVGQAVTLLELLAATTGDADDRALLDAALDAWLPPEVADDLRSRDEEARARRLAFALPKISSTSSGLRFPAKSSRSH